MTSLNLSAPAGFSDTAGRRHGRHARGCARGPIQFQPVHDSACKRSDLDECGSPVGFLPPTNFPRVGTLRPGAFFNARRCPSCKIISAAPHGSVSVSNSQHGQSYRVEVLGCGKSCLEIEKVRRRV